MSEFEIKPLDEIPVSAKHLKKKSLSDKIIKDFLNLNIKYAEIKLTADRKSKDVGRAIGRVLTSRYTDVVKYIGSDSTKNSLYLERISPIENIKNPEIPQTKVV